MGFLIKLSDNYNTLFIITADLLVYLKAGGVRGDIGGGDGDNSFESLSSTKLI